MFLGNLTDVEKKFFVCLAIGAANANSEIAAEESNHINAYCIEMGIDIADVLSMGSKTLDEIVDVFRRSEDSHKKIIIFEMIAFMYVDGSFDNYEKEYVYDFVEKIGFSREGTDEIIAKVENYISCVSDISGYIFG